MLFPDQHLGQVNLQFGHIILMYCNDLWTSNICATISIKSVFLKTMLGQVTI